MTGFNQSYIRQQVAQLIIVRASGHQSDFQREFPLWELTNQQLKGLLEEGIGGVILYGGTINELKNRCHQLQQWAQNPLFLCADIEEGLGQRFQGGTWLAPPMAIAHIYRKDSRRAIALAEQYGRCLGEEARLCGLNWALAPVCDINTNQSNPVINMRAWGEDPNSVSVLAGAFQKGLSSQGILTCLKHFPGHGDTSVDSHLELPIVPHDLARLESIEFLPFRTLIANGADAVMTAHLLLPKIDPSYPATLSNAVIRHLLRKNLKFDGLIVTDALIMEAISNTYGGKEAAILAFEAGADIILMPQNPSEAIDAISESLLSGRIPIERLKDSLYRRKKAIEKIENFPNKNNNSHLFIDSLANKDNDSSVFATTLLKESSEIFNPGCLSLNSKGINLLRVDDCFSCPYLNDSSPAISIPKQAGYRPILLHPLGVSPWQVNPDGPLALDRLGEDPLLLQIFVRGDPFRGAMHQKEPWLLTIQQLQQMDRLAGLVVYGSHYLWIQLSKALDPSLPAAYCPGQMQEAQIQMLDSLFPLAAKNTMSQSDPYARFTD